MCACVCAHECDVQIITKNVRLRVRCTKSALYSTKCTLESRMCKKSTKRTPESVMYKICHVVLNPPKNIPVLHVCVPKIPSCQVTFCIEVNHQVLEYVHVCSVGNGAGGG